MNRYYLFITCLLFPGFLAFAADSREQLSHVLQINAKIQGDSVVITWKDHDDSLNATYEVYRSGSEIAQDNFDKAELLGTVNAKIQRYEDIMPREKNFYLVLLRDKEGKRHDFFLHYITKTVVPILVNSQDPLHLAKISKLKAFVYYNQVLLEFQSEPASRQVMIFRSIKKISGLADLERAVLLDQITGDQIPYRDLPEPGIDFYYTVIDSRAFSEKVGEAFSSDNTLEKPIQLPLLSVSKGEKSALSLPLDSERNRQMSLEAFLNDSFPSLGLKKNQYGARDLPRPLILPEEKIVHVQGTPKILAQIVAIDFSQGEWKKALEKLDSLLHLSLEEKLAARTHFYRGQCLAFLKNYKDALLEILLAQEYYKDQTNSFIDSLLSLLHFSTGG